MIKPVLNVVKPVSNVVRPVSNVVKRVSNAVKQVEKRQAAVVSAQGTGSAVQRRGKRRREEEEEEVVEVEEEEEEEEMEEEEEEEESVVLRTEDARRGAGSNLVSPYNCRVHSVSEIFNRVSGLMMDVHTYVCPSCLGMYGDVMLECHAVTFEDLQIGNVTYICQAQAVIKR